MPPKQKRQTRKQRIAQETQELLSSLQERAKLVSISKVYEVQEESHNGFLWPALPLPKDMTRRELEQGRLPTSERTPTEIHQARLDRRIDEEMEPVVGSNGIMYDFYPMDEVKTKAWKELHPEYAIEAQGVQILIDSHLVEEKTTEEHGNILKIVYNDQKKH